MTKNNEEMKNGHVAFGEIEELLYGRFIVN
jgi:hypothetical protein